MIFDGVPHSDGPSSFSFEQPASVQELPGLWVSLDRVSYNPHVQTTSDRPFGFVYYITIHNDSDRAVTIKGRKWVVRSEDGTTLVVEGDGVVGEYPHLAPGASFRYNSYHLVHDDSTAEGAYLGLSEMGEAVLARIPVFKMELPLEA